MSLMRALLGWAVAVAPLGGKADAKSPPRYGAVVYSDLCYDKPSDDMGGTRITLLRFGYGDKIVYESTEGAVTWPVFAADAKVDAKTAALSFEVKTNEETLTFQGTFNDHALTGTLSGRSQPLRLRRIVDLGQPVPKCKF
jgi:hypothetical protein